jgi:hypothetical protein
MVQATLYLKLVSIVGLSETLDEREGAVNSEVVSSQGVYRQNGCNIAMLRRIHRIIKTQ